MEQRCINYSKERHNVITYFEIGRLLNEAGGKYGDNIIDEVKKSLDVILIASGTEVGFAKELKDELQKNYIEARIVSMPCIENFINQDKDYQNEVLPKGYKKIAIELSNDPTWYHILEKNDEFIGITRFGKSGDEEDVLKDFELDLHDLVIQIKNKI